MEKDSTKNKKSQKSLIIISILIVLLLVGIYWTGKDKQGNQDEVAETSQEEQTDPGEVVATVGDTEIMRAQLDAQLSQQQIPEGTDPATISQLEDQALTNLINTEVLFQHALTQVSVSDEEVDSEMASFRANFETEEAFQAELTQYNFTEEKLLDTIRRQLAIERFVAQFEEENPVELTDEEVRAEYDFYADQNDEIPPFEEVEEQVREQLKQQKIQERLIALVETLKKDIEITIHN